MVTCDELFIYLLSLYLPLFFSLFGLPSNAGLAAHSFTNNVQRSWRVTEAGPWVQTYWCNEGLISTEVGFTLKIFIM